MSLKRTYQLFFAFLVLLYDLTGKDRVNYVKALMTLYLFEIFYIEVLNIVVLKKGYAIVRALPALFNPSLQPLVLVTAILFALNLLFAGPGEISSIKDEIQRWPAKKVTRGYLISCCIVGITILLVVSSLLFIVATVPVPVRKLH